MTLKVEFAVFRVITRSHTGVSPFRFGDDQRRSACGSVPDAMQRAPYWRVAVFLVR